ncbi:hypothetical protein GCM10009850_112560 [Nonomuraea monospora]|uniref:Uncharacterized protein n=1 Tax=Nonomuraea monospora TaxID=568818 RepID=A0ABN3D2C2_9ACTN
MPSAASWSAAARPIPLFAPVIKATLWDVLCSFMVKLLLGGWSVFPGTRQPLRFVTSRRGGGAAGRAVTWRRTADRERRAASGERRAASGERRGGGRRWGGGRRGGGAFHVTEGPGCLVLVVETEMRVGRGMGVRVCAGSGGVAG